VVPLTVALNIIVKFLTNENVKPTKILMKFRAQYSDEMPSRTHMCDWSKSFRDS